jgi:hypothetical protein
MTPKTTTLTLDAKALGLLCSAVEDYLDDLQDLIEGNPQDSRLSMFLELLEETKTLHKTLDEALTQVQPSETVTFDE